MNEIILKIREYGQKREQAALQEYVGSISVDDFQELITAKVNHPEFANFWNYLLQGLNDNGDPSDKRFKIVRAAVVELKEKDVPATLSNSVMSRVFVELPKFKTEHLLDLCALCMEYIQQGNVSELRWREFLPELLNVIVERERVEYNDAEMSGTEYKTQFINSLCTIQWSANIIIPLSSMFINVPLSKEEHLQVINKLGQYVENLTPQEVPAFVYQLLRLGRHHNSRSIFLRLQNYFTTRIYTRTNTAQDTNSESLDFIGDSTNIDSVQAESTVLFHIYQSASLGHESIRDYLAGLKNLVKSPEVVLHPFQLSVLLTISSVPVHEEKAFEIIRAGISRSFHEERRRNESHWLREMVPDIVQMEVVLKQILENSLNDRPSVIQGLVNLGFVLLSVGSALGRDVIAEKQWHLGKYILQSLIKEKSGVASSIFERLSNHIITGNNASPCIECFHHLVRKFPMVTLENKRYVIQMMDDVLLHAPEPIANFILYAIMPLTKLAPTIRDHLILLLRKALYSRAAATRMVAVKGFLKLLTNLKITNPSDLSQPSNSSSSSSGYSLLTQITLSVHGHSGPSLFTNEALCLEVLGIVRRCFTQQGEIRAELYSGLYDAICSNPEIGGPVLDILWSQFNTYYVPDEDTSPPLHFSKITLTKDLDVSLQEPLGKLIYASGCITAKVLEKDEDHVSALRFESALNSVCKRMATCELIHFELDDGTNLLDVVPEAQQKLIILKEAMCVYEALIGYKVYSWKASSNNYAQEVNSLFQGYFRLLQFMKNLSKPKKAEKKKKDANKTSQRNETQTAKKDGGTKTKSVNPPKSILGFEVLAKTLNLLHSDVDWTTVSQANSLKAKHDLHRHAMQSTIQLLQVLKTQRVVDAHTSKVHYTYCTEISRLLYEKCIERLDDFMDFDKETAILSVECFYLMLHFITQNYDSLNDFVSAIVNQDKADPLTSLLKPIVETYQKLFEYEESIQTDEADIRKLLLLEINTLSLLLTKIPIELNNTLSHQFSEWLKQFATEQVTSSKAIATSFATMWFDAFIKFKSGISLFETIVTDLSHVIGTISERKETVQKYKIINELSAQCFLQQITSTFKQMLDDVDWTIARLRSEYAMVTYPSEADNEGRREKLKSKERGLCCQMCLLITVIHLLSDISVPAGALWEAVLKSFAHMYNTLNSLTKYFMSRSTKLNVVFQGARFERVIKLAGKQLSPDVNKFILYIEESQKEETSTQAKKKAGSVLKNKVLRETKLIPKVVLEMEQLSKSVIQLSNKTKVDLAKYIGPGTTRDFRIKDIKEVLERSDDHIAASLNTTGSGNDDSNLNNESSTEVNENESDEEIETDDESPPTKKTKA